MDFGKNTPQQPGGLKQRFVSALLYCTGEMQQLHTHMQDKFFPLQLVEWVLRGISCVILLNNPLSGALILAALLLESPWQALLGMLGLLASTFTAIILGQDREEVSSGLHGFNGMLVALLMGVFSSAGDWYWWLLLPVCLGGAATTFLSSSLAPVLDRWDLPVSVFPFNTVILLYLACTGTSNPYFPNHPAQPPGAPENTNHSQLHVPQLLQGVVLGVGQIFACGTVGPSLLILGAVFLFSPILAVYALLGSGISTMAALLSAYTDIALSNLLGVLGLPASSWAATLTGTLMLLLTGKNLKEYRIPTGKVASPEQNLHSHKQWSAANTNATDV
ncbi:urea transporter 2 isoform X2 [Carassius auratus]|uniref:Urea transporter n=1 Tax=Carassius auratus TaxID=7957 RepID=A0A6P6PMB5_CARAU|nr:urea transporter 2-like isoform X2 [Carassius auratus]